ncbi:hypothetical protein AOR02nite_07780 [Acetobacter orientalis]|uniref:Uncharacterized protein n=1 Tax=Acetobacter orientalis TaxID=146474 RepID=A0A0D6NJ18_9PROT|nr:hypothetical protein Abor_008_022 [Acetobacter orientalis]GEL60936.1 hypothetical protein AOR02nite_07780 [Acetobacter orientalis]
MENGLVLAWLASVLSACAARGVKPDKQLEAKSKKAHLRTTNADWRYKEWVMCRFAPACK